MEFIEPEQFLKEDKEVQKVFIKWWKPSIGDLFWFETVNFYHLGLITHEKIKVFQTDCPAFTEGQLRKFIEDKTNCIVKIGTTHVRHKEKVNYFFILDYYIRPKEIIRNLGNNLLQAYWQVAVQIAREEVLNEKNNKNNK